MKLKHYFIMTTDNKYKNNKKLPLILLVYRIKNYPI